MVSPCLFNLFMDGEVREVNARVLGTGLELPIVNGGSFEIKMLYLLMK